MQNFGQFLITIWKFLLELPSKLYLVLTTEIDIKWVSKLLAFFGASDLGFPESISLIYIIGGASGILLLTLIIYRIFR